MAVAVPAVVRVGEASWSMFRKSDTFSRIMCEMNTKSEVERFAGGLDIVSVIFIRISRQVHPVPSLSSDLEMHVAMRLA